jgi:serine/threonine protein kinase
MSSNKKTKKQKLIIDKGGKAIGAGGYGCVFKPALKCIGKPRNETKISKLMTKESAKEEYEDIVRFLPYLKQIPNYEKYFLVYDVSICKPDKLTEEDLKDYTEKCKNLSKKGFESENINDPKNLKELSIVNMPYGGLDIGDFIEHTLLENGGISRNYKKLIELNNKLIDLLKNGVVPMNRKNIFHCDFKDSNVLVDEKMNTRVIDWGLSCKYDNKNEVPSILQRRPIQFNIPFSNILFNDEFSSSYKSFLTKNDNPSFLTTREFVMDFFFRWIDIRGPGHLKSINNTLKILFENGLISINDELKDQLIEFDYTFYFIFEYITKILMKFSKNGEFDEIAYLKIFLKNIDIWGFAMIYIPLLEVIYNGIKIDKIEMKIISKIKDIIILVFETADHEIDTDKLIRLYKDLSEIFSKYKSISRRSVKTFKTSKNKTMRNTTGQMHKINEKGGNLSKSIKKIKNKKFSFIKSFYKIYNKKK